MQVRAMALLSVDWTKIIGKDIGLVAEDLKNILSAIWEKITGKDIG